MNNKKVLICMMCGVLVLGGFFIVKRTSRTNEEFFDNTKNNLQEKEDISTTDDDAKSEESNCVTVTQQDGTDDSDVESDNCVTVTQQKDEEEVNDASGAIVGESEIEKTEVNVKDMSEELKQQIIEYDAFVYAIKKCFYEAGIMETEVTCLNRITYDYKDNLVYISMYVPSSSITYFDVVYNQTQGTYYIVAN